MTVGPCYDETITTNSCSFLLSRSNNKAANLNKGLFDKSKEKEEENENDLQQLLLKGSGFGGRGGGPARYNTNGILLGFPLASSMMTMIPHSANKGQTVTPPLVPSPSPPDPPSTSTVAAPKAANSDLSSLLSNVPFPLRLHAMLDDAYHMGFQYIVSWMADGHAFKVHQPDAFVSQVLSTYFNNQTRYKSFQRQLNIYGFHRVSKGFEKGLCFHPLFRRGQPDLCAAMQRIKIKDPSNEDDTHLVMASTSSSSSDPLQPILSSKETILTHPVSASSSSASSASSDTLSSSDGSNNSRDQEEDEMDEERTFDIAFFEGKSF